MRRRSNMFIKNSKSQSVNNTTQHSPIHPKGNEATKHSSPSIQRLVRMSLTYVTIDAVAIVGRDNDPLYFKTFGDAASTEKIFNAGTGEEETKGTDSETTTELLLEPDPDVYLRLLLYSALDLVEERSRGLAEKNVYLGQLCVGDQRKVYGFVTTTSIKFMVVITDESNDGKGVAQDGTMKDFFRSIHGLFVDTMSNPFSQTTQSGTRDVRFVPSKRFEATMKKITTSLESALRKR